jgi:UDP-glucose 4-epimerase
VNVGGLVSLLEAMSAADVKALVFSSSASVYSPAAPAPFFEDSPTEARHPYGASKLTSEHILWQMQNADREFAVGLLRYFNPAGADFSGKLGEPFGSQPRSLFANIAQAAMDSERFIEIFGDDYPTPDGTALRDFIHVSDLARAHVLALKPLLESRRSFLCNIGTGEPMSVREAVLAYASTAQREISVRVSQRRPGDLPIAYADTTRASEVLGFHAEHRLDAICESDWRWRRSGASR